MLSVFIMGAALLLLFPINAVSAENNLTFFNYTSNTGNNATVVIPRESDIMINGAPIEQYDEIGVFTPDGLCVGGVVWHPDSSLAITVWGNNENTTDIDGMEFDEEMQFRVWQQSTNTVYGESDVEFLDHPFASRNDGKYRIDGRYVVGSLDAKTALSVEDYLISETIPDDFSLYQNYPNPFNPETTIRYSVAEASDVRITVHNLIGQKIAKLAEGFHPPGHYEVKFRSEGHASGIYLYRMEAKDFSVTKKFVLLQ